MRLGKLLGALVALGGLLSGADATMISSNKRSTAAAAVGKQRQQDEVILSTLSARAALAKDSSERKQRLKRHLRLVTVESPPFMMKQRPTEVGAPTGGAERSNKPDPASNQTHWFGYCMDFFLELIKHLPYEVSWEIYEVADGKFGSKTRSVLTEKRNVSGKLETHFRRLESWNGLVGELARGHAELALAPLAVMAERELEIDFTVPFYDLIGIQILLKRPEVPQNWFKFLTVLDNEVWLSIALAYFVTSFIIYLFDRLSPYSHKNQVRIRRIHESHQRASMDFPHMKSVQVHSNLAQPQHDKPLELNKFYLSRSISETLAERDKLAQVGSLEAASPAFVLPSKGKSKLELLGPVKNSSARHRRASQDYLEQLRSQFKLTKTNEQQGNAYENNDDDDDDDEMHGEANGRPDFNLRDSLWFCITSLTPQGGGEAPQNLSGRLVAGAWWLFCFIVIASYTANLAAFLTVSRLDIPIESLDELAKQYRIKYAPIDGTAEQTYFERMAYIEEIFYNIWKEMSLNDSLPEHERSKFSVWDYPISDKYTRIWAQIQEAGMPSSIEAALERVRASSLDDGFALLADANLVKYAVMTDCQLKAVGEEFSRKPIALGLAKGQDSLREDISYAILQLINRRFMEVLREKWWTNNAARKQCSANDESEGISIENIGGVFIIILAGILLSFLAWAIERYAYATKLDLSRELLEPAAN